MRASEIKAFRHMGTVAVTDRCFQGRPPEVECFYNEAAEVAFQLFEPGGEYRHTDPLQGEAKPYGDWKRLTLES